MEIDAEAGKPEVLGEVGALQTAPAVIKHLGVVGQFPRHAVPHFVDLHRLLEEQAEVEKLDLEAQLLVCPQRMVVTVADGLVLVPVERRHLGGQVAGLWLVGLLGQGARAALEPGVVERLGLAQGFQARGNIGSGRSGRGYRSRQVDAGQGQRGGCLEQVTTMHEAPSLKVMRRNTLAIARRRACRTGNVAAQRRRHDTEPCRRGFCPER